MRLDQLVLGLFVFSFVIVTGVLWIGDTNTNYASMGANMSTEDFSNVYNTINDTYALGQGMKNATLDADISETDSWESMTRGSYSGIRLIKNSFGIIGNVINDLALSLGIPEYIVVFAMGALAVSIVFGIIFILMRFNP